MALKYLYFFIILNLISCTSQNNGIPTTVYNAHSVDSSPELKDTVKLKKSVSKQNKVESVKSEYRRICNDAKEMDFYKKNGKITYEDKNSVVYEYHNNLIEIKALFSDCHLVHRTIKSKKTCAISFAKLVKNKLITFDSTDVNCNNYIQYVDEGIFFSENKQLPKYLLKYVH